MRWGKWGAGFETRDYQNMIEACLGIGINQFDHADIYGNYTTENEFGKVLKQVPSLRTEIEIITKCGIQLPGVNSAFTDKSYNTSQLHIIQSVEKSLRNFNTDYIDLLLLHRPDPLMNPYEIAAAIDSLKQAGKIKHFGVSNFKPSQCKLLQSTTAVAYNQIEISIIMLDAFINGTLDQCIYDKIIPMAWSPLGGGKLTDAASARYRSITNAAFALSEKYGYPANDILISWLANHPAGIVPILGTTKIDRLSAANKALHLQMDRADWYRLWTASTGEEIA